MMFNQSEIVITCQDRCRLAQNAPPGYRALWLTIGDRTIVQRTEISEAWSLKFNHVNQNRRSIVHDIHQKMQRQQKTRCRPVLMETVAVSILNFRNISVWPMLMETVAVSILNLKILMFCFSVLCHFRCSFSREWDILFSTVFYHFCKSFPLQQLVVHTQTGFEGLGYNEGARLNTVSKDR